MHNSVSTLPAIRFEMNAVAGRSSESTGTGRGEVNQLIGRSAAVRQIVEQVDSFARSSAPVLITGESGTGKEVLARLIHQQSYRADLRYVRVNCAALSESLIESELFGHEKGAFTGANDDHVGRFEWAGRGTLLLDEISEIPPGLQAKLLRVLEEEEFQRVGSNLPLPMEARIIATSNRQLNEEVAAGRFRQDLYYRLDVLHLRIPPLRERRDDIPDLANFFLLKFQTEGQAIVSHIKPDAMARLQQADWPGNIRQLRNVIRRLCIVARSSVVTVDDLSFLDETGTQATSDRLYDMTLRDVERVLIAASIRRFRGNRTAAARHLGVTSRTLLNRLRQEPELDRDCA